MNSTDLFRKLYNCIQDLDVSFLCKTHHHTIEVKLNFLESGAAEGLKIAQSTDKFTSDNSVWWVWRYFFWVLIFQIFEDSAFNTSKSSLYLLIALDSLAMSSKTFSKSQ